MRRWSRFAITAALVGAACVVTSAPASAESLTCGDTITEDTVLDHDLVDCVDVGLIIGADDITLNLGGHTIDGILSDDDDSRTVAIDNTEGHNNLVVTNGRLQEFVEGVLDEGGDGLTVRNIHASNLAHVGVYAFETSNMLITNNRFADAGGGVVFEESVDGIVRGNRMNSLLFAAVSIFGGGDVRVERNQIVDTSYSFPDDEGGVGIGLFRTTGVVATANTISGSNFTGFVMDGVQNAQLASNVLRNNANGIVGTGDNVTIANNRISGGGRECDDCGAGISYEGGSNASIIGNTVTGARRVGIRLNAFEPDTPPNVGTVVQHNTVVRSAGDGILIEEPTIDALVRNNRSNSNAGDGINNQNPSTRLQMNSANANRNLGINAVDGTIDGHGNTARGNRNTDQCVGVECNHLWFWGGLP